MSHYEHLAFGWKVSNNGLFILLCVLYIISIWMVFESYRHKIVKFRIKRHNSASSGTNVELLTRLRLLYLLLWDKILSNTKTFVILSRASRPHFLQILSGVNDLLFNAIKWLCANRADK